MAIVHRGTPKYFVNSWPDTDTSTEIAAVAGIQNDDLLMAFIYLGGDGSPANVALGGWSKLSENTYTDGSWVVTTTVMYKVASGESGSYTFTHDNGVNESCLFALSGTDTSSPFVPTRTWDNSTGTGHPSISVAPTITPARDNCLVIFHEGHWDAGGMVVPTGSTPTFTERYDRGAEDGAIGYIADGILATAGATGAKSVTNPNGDDLPWGAGLICVQAAAAGTTVPPLMYHYKNQ